MKYFFLLLTLALTLPAQAQFGKTLDRLSKKANDVLEGRAPLSQDEVGQALKEALDQGVGKAVTTLSAEDGYLESPYKILLPEEARAIVARVAKLPGFQNVEQDLIQRINRAAELAATEAGPIFVGAIQEMTFADALNLLTGEDDAATRYLENKTFDPLTGKFLPVIERSLDEVSANAIWTKITTAYNKIPFVQKTESDLSRYVTERALGGMFGLIEVKETELRNNPALRNTELLQRVFARQD